MRWLPFFILLYLAAALQVAELGRLTTGGYLRIEFLPLLALFYALFADEQLAPIAALICGLTYDLLSPNPLGTFSIALGLVALGILKIRLSVFRDQMISQLILSILALLAFAFLVAIVGGITGGLAGQTLRVWRTLSANAVYSGVLAPLFFWLLGRLNPMLGFPAVRKTPR
jgi:rod shape-determining protein MreD